MLHNFYIDISVFSGGSLMAHTYQPTLGTSGVDVAGKEITVSVGKAVVARDGGRCRYPDCGALLVEQTSNGNWVATGEFAHIRAVGSGGPRHDPDYEDVNGSQNLLFMCSLHHRRIDREPSIYSVEVLEAFLSPMVVRRRIDVDSMPSRWIEWMSHRSMTLAERRMEMSVRLQARRGAQSYLQRLRRAAVPAS
jgi:hypothetical protein